MQVSYSIHTLNFKNTFTISHSGAKDTKQTLILKLSINGFEGYGESIENDYWGLSIESHITTLLEVKNYLEKIDEIPYPPEIWNDLYDRLKQNMFLLCAIDVALWDLWAKSKNQPIYKSLELESEKVCESSFTIGIDSTDKMLKKLAEEPDWPIYKVKLSQKTDSVGILNKMRQQEPNAKFIVDANCAWNIDHTINISREFEKLNVCLIEQPLERGMNKENQKIIKNTNIPIFADESCMVEADIDD